MSDDTRVAIVAGAAGELGRATAATLTDRGFLVVGIDRSESGLKELPVTEIVSSDKGTMTATASRPGDPYMCLRPGAAPDFSSSLRLRADGCHLCELALEQLGGAVAPVGSYGR